MMCFSRFILALLFLTASVKLSIASVQDDQALASKMIQRRAPQASDTSKSPDEQGPTEASAAHKKGSKNTKSGASKGGLSKQVDEFCTNILLAQENLSPLLIFDYPQWSGLSQHELLQKFEPICIKYIEDHYPDIMKLEHNSAGLKDPKTGKVWPKYQNIAGITAVPGSKDAFAGSCEVLEIDNILWYTSSDATYQQVNSWTKHPLGTHGEVTQKVLDSMGAAPSKFPNPCPH